MESISKRIDVKISNKTTRTVTISPKSVNIELKPVDIQKPYTLFSIPLLEQVNID